MNIAIIGGGYTGLTAAYYLSRAGHQVSIFEAGPEIGGLASGLKIAGANIEKTYHHLFKTDTDIIELAAELGAQIDWYPSSVSIYCQGQLYDFNGPGDLLRFSALSFVSRLRTAIVLAFLKFYNNWQSFINISAYQWMSRWAGAESTQVIWGPLLQGKFSGFAQQISMAWLWARIHIRANSRSFSLQDSAEYLGYFRGGFHSFTTKLLAELAKYNVKVYVNQKVSAISSNLDTGLVSIELSDSEAKFERVLATIPCHTFAKLIGTDSQASPAYLGQLTAIEYLGAICLIYSSKQSLSKSYWHNINDKSFPFLVFLQHTNLVSRSNYQGQEIYYIGTYLPHDHRYWETTEAEILIEWFAALKKIFPEFDGCQVQERHLFKLKNAQHIADLNYQSKIPAVTTPLKNVYLSNFSQIFPEDRGTNFAVREGKKATNLILQNPN